MCGISVGQKLAPKGGGGEEGGLAFWGQQMRVKSRVSPLSKVLTRRGGHGCLVYRGARTKCVGLKKQQIFSSVGVLGK